MSARLKKTNIYDVHAVERLLQRVRTNPEKHHAVFYEVFWSDAYRLAYGICGNTHDAEDAAQTALTQALNKLDMLDNPKAVLKWLRRIVSNAALYQCREEHRRMAGFRHIDVDISDVDAFPEDLSAAFNGESALSSESFSHELPDELVMREEVHRIIFDLINELAPKQRQAVMLYYYADLSVAEIADDLNVTENSVSALLFRARETLNAQIQKVEQTQEIKLHGTTAIPLAQILKEAAQTQIVPPAIPPASAMTDFPSLLHCMKIFDKGVHLSAKQWMAIGLTATVMTTGAFVAFSQPAPEPEITPIPVTKDVKDAIRPAEEDVEEDIVEPVVPEEEVFFGYELPESEPTVTGSDDLSPVAPILQHSRDLDISEISESDQSGLGMSDFDETSGSGLSMGPIVINEER